LAAIWSGYGPCASFRLVTVNGTQELVISAFQLTVLLFHNVRLPSNELPFFQFGGKLVTFEHDRNAVAQAAAASQQPGFVAPSVIPRIVTISQVVTEPELVARADSLESALQQGEYRDFCTARSSSTDSPHKKFLWECLKSNFAPEPSVELLRLLGFNVQEVNSKVSQTRI